MRTFRGALIVLAGCLFLFCACAASTDEGTELSAGGGGKSPEVLKPREAEGSVTLFPVSMAGRPSKEVAEVLGLLLEHEGLQGIELAESAFAPAPGGAWDEVGPSFAAHVRENPVETDYALYGEFLGSPDTGVQAVRGVMVDRAGEVVWKDAQRPGDTEFEEKKPRNPMSCCVFLVERLRPVLHLPGPSGKEEGEGKMARLWAKKSGLPEKAELTAMEERLSSMKKAGREARVVIHPIRVRDQVDRAAAVHLADLLNKGNLCRAEVAGTSPYLEVPPNSNEQKMLWDLARAFQAQVRKEAPTGDFALYGDYMVSPRDGRVMAVHFVVCDRKGEWVIVDYQNDHHGDFQAIDPSSIEDCSRLAAKRLEGYLR